MDIQYLGNDTLRIKSKKTTLAVDPKSQVAKFDADAILIIDKSSDPSRVNTSRITLDGPGEYELSGLKISGIKTETDNENMYILIADNANALIAKSSSLEKMSADKLGECQIAIINADSDLNQSIVTAIEARVVILYGEKAREGAKALGKEGAASSSKISLSEDKLPEELDVMLLS